MKRGLFVLYWCKEFFFWEKILPNIGCAERCFCALLRIEVYFFQFCCFLTGGFEWGRMIRGIAVEIMMAPCYDNSVLKQRVRPDVKVCGFFMWYMWLELLLWKVLTVNSNFDAPCFRAWGVFGGVLLDGKQIHKMKWYSAKKWMAILQMIWERRLAWKKGLQS